MANQQGNSLGLSSSDADFVLGEAQSHILQKKLDDGLKYAQSEKKDWSLAAPGTIESVIAEALETGDASDVLAKMTELIGTRLQDVTDSGVKIKGAINVLKQWRMDHQAEMNELRMDSPAYRQSVKSISDMLEGLEGRDFKTIEEAKAAYLMVYMEIKKHNDRFVGERAHQSIAETELKTVEVSLEGRPFTIRLVSIGTGKMLGLPIRSKGAINKDEAFRIMYGEEEAKAA